MPYIEDQGTLSGVFRRVTEDPLLSKQNAKYIEAHIEFMKAKQSNIRTQIKHLYHIRRFYRLLKNPKKDFRQLTREDMQATMARMEGTEYGVETKRNIKVVVKYFWKHLKGDDEFYPQEVRWLKTSGDRKDRKLPEDMLTEDEIRQMIESATTLRNKAIIAILYDTGCRIGELLNIRKKDVNLSTTPAHVLLDGKTGQRQVPVIFSAPYVAQYLNFIKEKKPNEPLWTSYNNGKDTDRRTDYAGIAKMLKVTAKKAKIEKRVHPHLFRHSRATAYANKLTEQQLKNMFGWTNSSTMAATYVHLSGRDIDSAVMQANGLKLKEDTTEPKLKAKVCQRCQFSNTMDSKYCNRCALPLDAELAAETQSHETNMKQAIAEALKDPKAIEEIVHAYLLMQAKKGKNRVIV